MDFQTTRNYLLPRCECDVKLREYLIRLSASGLRTLAVVEIAAAMLLHFGRMAAGAARWPQTLSLVGVGVLTLAMAKLPAGRRFPRLMCALSVWLGAALLMLPGESPAADDYTITAITLVLVTAVATVPLLPWQALAVGLSIEGMYILSAVWELPVSPAHGEAHHIFLLLLAMLATGIAASNYEHRRSEFETHQEAVRVAEALTGAQLRAELAENAISIGKMAAALSHEINSPLGALRSSIETLLAVTDRQIEAPPEQRERLAATRIELRRSIEESATRVGEVTRRLRRFVNLEEAEVKAADINDLLSDVTLLHQDEIRDAHVEVEFDLEKPLPPLNCRPQLLTAAFSTLLSNAIHAVNGDGRIAIETRGRNGEVEITIRDNGRGMSPEEADTIFDPSFRVAEGRVSSGNWSLFNSRQIVYEHGGEIRLETAPGEGTAMHVTLPVV
jgi:two-component system NtrC family sensor kinase